VVSVLGESSSSRIRASTSCVLSGAPMAAERSEADVERAAGRAHELRLIRSGRRDPAGRRLRGGPGKPYAGNRTLGSK